MVVRLSLAYLAYRRPDLAQRYSLLALVPVAGWLWIYFVSGRDTGPEVFGERIWWNQLRVPHAMLWSLFALYAYQGQSYSWVPLLIDPLLGLMGWTNNYFTEALAQKRAVLQGLIP